MNFILLGKVNKRMVFSKCNMYGNAWLYLMIYIYKCAYLIIYVQCTSTMKYWMRFFLIRIWKWVASSYFACFLLGGIHIVDLESFFPKTWISKANLFSQFIDIRIRLWLTSSLEVEGLDEISVHERFSSMGGICLKREKIEYR